jgi:hypothetical protein
MYSLNMAKIGPNANKSAARYMIDNLDDLIESVHLNRAVMRQTNKNIKK